MLRSLALCVALAGCSSGGTSHDAPPTDDFDRTALLVHLTDHLLVPLQDQAAQKAGALPAAIAAHCDALDAATTGTTLETARSAWVAAMDAWEAADTVVVGPAGMDNRTLRDRIYGWPLVSTCGIDRDTATRWANPASYDASAALVNVRSLAAIEFLLYPPFTSHSCPTTPTGWDAIGADLPRARCRQAHAIAVDVAAQVAAVNTAWRADGGDYAGELKGAGHGSSITTAQAGINLVSDGMFYVDRMVKDMKLAEAAGIAINACGTVGEPCDREIELRFADRGTFALRTNLATLRAAFTGTTLAGDGPGFDDFLRAAGHPEIADRMTASLDAAIAKAAALPDSFLAALTTQYPAVVATHAEVTAFTTDMKSQFLTVLALDIPDDVAADND